LKHLFRHRPPNKKMVIILDNSRYHHARSLQPWLWDHRRKLRLDFLPPYSPQLNPIERLWKLTRKLCVHNRYFPTLQDLILTVGNQFAIWAKSNDTLRRLCAII
jgi:transposase